MCSIIWSPVGGVGCFSSQAGLTSWPAQQLIAAQTQMYPRAYEIDVIYCPWAGNYWLGGTWEGRFRTGQLINVSYRLDVEFIRSVFHPRNHSHSGKQSLWCSQRKPVCVSARWMCVNNVFVYVLEWVCADCLLIYYKNNCPSGTWRPCDSPKRFIIYTPQSNGIVERFVF